MRQLIESLNPDRNPIEWRWVAGMLAFYMVAMAIMTIAFVDHRSPKTHGMVQTTAIGASHAIIDASLPATRQASR